MRSPVSVFVREPYPFPSFPGREVLTVQFLGPGGETVLNCYVHDLYDGQQMRPEKLEAWRALRERHGDRDESGSIEAPSWPRLPEPLRSPPAGTVSSNADVLDRTDADRLEHVGADQPKHRTASDGFKH
jgi:hypothetical protein